MPFVSAYATQNWSWCEKLTYVTYKIILIIISADLNTLWTAIYFAKQ